MWLDLFSDSVIYANEHLHISGCVLLVELDLIPLNLYMIPRTKKNFIHSHSVSCTSHFRFSLKLLKNDDLFVSFHLLFKCLFAIPM